MGKGSKRRPQHVGNNTMDDNWRMAFEKRKEQNTEKNRYKRGGGNNSSYINDDDK